MRSTLYGYTKKFKPHAQHIEGLCWHAEHHRLVQTEVNTDSGEELKATGGAKILLLGQHLQQKYFIGRLHAICGCLIFQNNRIVSAQLHYCAVYPPSIEWTLPVMKAARSLNRYATKSATSSRVARRFMGCALAIQSVISLPDSIIRWVAT